MTPLRQKMIRKMQMRRLAERSQQAYLHWMIQLSRHYNCSPDQLSVDQLQHYIHHLLHDRALAWSSVNQAACAIRWFCVHVLGRDDPKFDIGPRTRPKRLPEIYSADELGRLFDAASNPKHRTLLMTAYAAGLRVGEVVALKAADIDSYRMMIRVEQGKGRKDRYTLLSHRLLEQLRGYCRTYRLTRRFRGPLFFGRDHDKPMDTRTAQRIFYRARDRAALRVIGGIHLLRHCFATHLMDAGVDVRTIQQLMGHRAVTTTMRYLQVTRAHLANVKSPLDLIQFNDDGEKKRA